MVEVRLDVEVYLLFGVVKLGRVRERRVLGRG